MLNLTLAKQLNIRFLNDNEILNKDFFWGICLNNPRFATNSMTDDKNCFLNPHDKSHQIFEIVKVPDYVLILYKKKVFINWIVIFHHYKYLIFNNKNIFVRFNN